jgi:hypothetical protein
MKPIAFNYENFSALQEENLYLAKSVAELARESVEREKALARLEAEVMAAIEPKRGEWVLVGTNEHDYETSVEEKCSLCGRYVYRYDTEPQDNYCPNCGADNRGSEVKE